MQKKHSTITMSFLVKTVLLPCMLMLPSSTYVVGDRYVTIINNLGGDPKLTFHCITYVKDLGEHLLKPGQSYKWNFPADDIINSPSYSCSIKWQGATKQFDIYLPNQPLIDLVWSITKDSPCLLDQKNNNIFCYPWNKP